MNQKKKFFKLDEKFNSNNKYTIINNNIMNYIKNTM